jgi:cation transport regulator ChaB
MPKTTKSGAPKKSELPSTLVKSGKKAQRTFTRTYDSAMDEYGDEKRAHRTAFSALKHSFEKSVTVGNRRIRRGRRTRGPKAGDPIPRASRPKEWTPTPVRTIYSRSPVAWTSKAARA